MTRTQGNVKDESPYELLVFGHALVLARFPPKGEMEILPLTESYLRSSIKTCKDLESGGVNKHLKTRLCERREPVDVLVKEDEGVEEDAQLLICQGKISTDRAGEWKQWCEKRFGKLLLEQAP